MLIGHCRQFGVELYYQVCTDEVYGDLPLDPPDLFCITSGLKSVLGFKSFCCLNKFSEKLIPVDGIGENIRVWLHGDGNCTAINLILHQGRRVKFTYWCIMKKRI